MRVAPLTLLLVAVVLALIPSYSEATKPFNSLEAQLFAELSGTGDALSSLEDTISRDMLPIQRATARYFKAPSVPSTSLAEVTSTSSRKENAAKKAVAKKAKKAKKAAKKAKKAVKKAKKAAKKAKKAKKAAKKYKANIKKLEAQLKKANDAVKAKKKQLKRLEKNLAGLLKISKANTPMVAAEKRAIQKQKLAIEKALSKVAEIESKIHRSGAKKKFDAMNSKATKSIRKLMEKNRKRLADIMKKHSRKLQSLKRQPITYKASDKLTKAYLRRFKKTIRDEMRNVYRQLQFHDPRTDREPRFIGKGPYNHFIMPTKPGEQAMYDELYTRNMYKNNAATFRENELVSIEGSVKANRDEKIDLLQTFPWPRPEPNMLL